MGGFPSAEHADRPAPGPVVEPRPASSIRRPALAWRKPRFSAVRAAQAAAGTAACGLVLFGGYATSAYLRNTPTQLPVLTPVKASIPPAPVIQPPPAPETATANLIPPSPVQTPPAHQPHRITAHPLAAPAFRPTPAAELPPPPSRLAAPGSEPQTAALPVLTPPPALSGPAVTARRNADNPVDLVEPPPEPAAETSLPEKKHNRFFRALHKVVVVPFRKEEGSDATVTGPQAQSH